MLGAMHRGLAAELLVLLVRDGMLKPWDGSVLLGVHLKHKFFGKLPGESVA